MTAVLNTLMHTLESAGLVVAANKGVRVFGGYSLPSAFRASSTNLDIQYARSSTCVCSSGVLTGASPVVSTIDARAVAQSLHTPDSPSDCALVFFRDASKSKLFIPQ